MYFPGDPLLAFDPIFHAVPDEHARNRLIAAFDLDITEPDYAWGFVSTWCCAGAAPRRWALSDDDRDSQPDHRTLLAPDGGSSWADLTRFGAGGEDHADRRGVGWRR